jgi:hypothetical protein
LKIISPMTKKIPAEASNCTADFEAISAT